VAARNTCWWSVLAVQSLI